MSKIKHSYNRILEISDDHKQITLPDSRYYRRNGMYYPSITYVLSSYPKGKQFEEWLKNMGRSADYIVKKAGEEGTQVHELVEEYLEGKDINFLDFKGNPQYNPDVWLMFLKFVEFWETYNPKLIETEVHLFSDEYEVAGTCDLICEIDGKLWLLDVKTSNMMHSTYELQTSNKEKMTGKGWEVITPKRTQEENLKIFKTVKHLFDLEHPEDGPSFTEFPTQIKRNL
jgi:hypothetical protein